MGGTLMAPERSALFTRVMLFAGLGDSGVHAG